MTADNLFEQVFDYLDVQREKKGANIEDTLASLIGFLLAQIDLGFDKPTIRQNLIEWTQQLKETNG
jgi:hypothetical protein